MMSDIDTKEAHVARLALDSPAEKDVSFAKEMHGDSIDTRLPYTAEEARAVVRKTDMVIMPLVSLRFVNTLSLLANSWNVALHGLLLAVP